MRINVENVIPKDAVPGLVLPKVARWVVDESAFANEEGSPFRASLQEADPRVLLVVGENASGKSLAFRLIASILGEAQVMPITLSIRERAALCQDGMASMKRAMIFGDERHKSTGATSAAVVESGFKNLDRPNPAALLLDEPEMGLSDGYAEALGELIGTTAAEPPEKSCGVCVVTHSRALGRGLIKGLKASPTVLNLSDQPLSADQWIETREVRSIEDLKALRDTALERFRTAHKILGL